MGEIVGECITCSPSRGRSPRPCRRRRSFRGRERASERERESGRERDPGPVRVSGVKWALIAKVDSSEAFAPIKRLERDLIIVGVLALLSDCLLGALYRRLTPWARGS